MIYLENGSSFLGHVMLTASSFGFGGCCLGWSDEKTGTLIYVHEEMESASFESHTGPPYIVWEERIGGVCAESSGPSSCSHGDCEIASGGLLVTKESDCTFLSDL